MLLMPLTVSAADQAIMFELGFGFGHSSKVTKTEDELANPFNNIFCYHRPSSTMSYMAVRYKYDRVESHVAYWMNESDKPKCDRNSFAVGLGYVFDTQDIGGNSVDDIYATYTPGIAYTWGKNKDFNVQDNTNTNWRLKDNWQMYNRVAVGAGNEDMLAEVAVVRYGLPVVDYERKGENFMTFTVGWRDFDSLDEDGDRGLTPPVGDTIINEGDNITNEGDNVTNINITDDSITNIIVPPGYQELVPAPPVTPTPPPPAPE